MVATVLSAQCTDERINRVTPALFKRLADAAAAPHDGARSDATGPRADWQNLSIRLISHGRAICSARKPRCQEGPIAERCPVTLDGRVGSYQC